MWAARDKRYGGLSARYKTHRQGLARMLNPFTAESMDFKNLLHADNWLLRAFCPGVSECSYGVSGFNILEGGQVKGIVIDTFTTFKDGIRIADLVVTKRTPAVEKSWKTLQQMGTVHRFTPCLRARQEIRANSVLLENLDTMRQHLVQHRRYFPIVMHDVLRSLAYGASTKLELSRALAHRPHSDEVIDTVLFMLYREDKVAINIAEVAYGVETKFALKNVS